MALFSFFQRPLAQQQCQSLLAEAFFCMMDLFVVYFLYSALLNRFFYFVGFVFRDSIRNIVFFGKSQS